MYFDRAIWEHELLTLKKIGKRIYISIGIASFDPTLHALYFCLPLFVSSSKVGCIYSL
jgi:hypothetical protein